MTVMNQEGTNSIVFTVLDVRMCLPVCLVVKNGSFSTVSDLQRFQRWVMLNNESIVYLQIRCAVQVFGKGAVLCERVLKMHASKIPENNYFHRL